MVSFSGMASYEWLFCGDRVSQACDSRASSGKLRFDLYFRDCPPLGGPKRPGFFNMGLLFILGRKRRKELRFCWMIGRIVYG